MKLKKDASDSASASTELSDKLTSARKASCEMA
jgi:hypothetical protein